MGYTTIQGDTWDTIAKKVYGSEWKADFLMQQNGELLAYFIFPSNVEVNTPELPEEIDADLPDWRD